MKRITILTILGLFLFFQKSNSERKYFVINKKIITPQQDSSTWIQKLKEFKTAISLNDKNKVKSFFDFPLANTNNDIWLLVNENNQQKEEQMSDKLKSFTEEDFDNNYNKLFPKKFLNCISKLKIDELSKKGETETIKLKENTSTTYQVYASIDKVEKTLTLALGNQKVVKNKKGEIEETEEYGTLYIFSIKNGQLKFVRIGLTA